MCNFKSGIIFKNRVELAPDGNESHSDLLESLGIEDNHMNAAKKFVRAELTPLDGNKAKDICEWKFKTDQDILPDWYTDDAEKYEQEFRNAVAESLKGKFEVFCGYPWIPIKADDKGTYYLMDGKYADMMFGNNNNYAESNVRESLINSKLAKDLKNEFGDRLVPIATNLLSIDGLDDYGVVDGDNLAIPTVDLYRECRKKIFGIGKPYWLATPDSTPSGCGSDFALCVSAGGGVLCVWYDYVGAVRPFFILKS